jgi:hypothetical protein
MKTGLKRQGNECYYTKEDISLDLVKRLNTSLKLNSYDLKGYDLIVEPSAGNGSFLNAIKEEIKEQIKSITIKAYDIELQDPELEIKEKDYFELSNEEIKRNEKTDKEIKKNELSNEEIKKNELSNEEIKTNEEIDKEFKNILVLGNPPFGRNSNLATKFIKKSCEYANTIAFVLPKSFKKPSKFKAFGIKFHLIEKPYDLPKNSFLMGEQELDVPCSFFIYQKKQHVRNKEPINIPNKSYTFIKKCDIKETGNIVAFRRVGSNAGEFKIDNILDLSEQSHYFISSTSSLKYAECNFEENNTVGPKSISKQDLIKELNKQNK